MSTFFSAAAGAQSLPDGQPCSHAADCSSTYCYPGPDDGYYCVNASENCAEPGASGVLFGDSYVYSGVNYDCVMGSGLAFAGYVDGQSCTYSTLCASTYCGAGPDQNYCFAATANCPEPGTSGVQYGDSYVYAGATYDCVQGYGIMPDSGVADGAPCVRHAQCASGYCYPGPDLYYCLGADENCAQPGTDGILFGQSYEYQAVTYQCVAGTGLVAPTLLDDGQACTDDSQCTSRYCYPGPDQDYCLGAQFNCAQPGTDGVLFGESYVYDGATYDCVAGRGLAFAGYVDGQACMDATQCVSTYCAPGPDQEYCFSGTANCPEPGTSGVQYGESYLYDGVTYDCIEGYGIMPDSGVANGAPCVHDSQCASSFCYPGPDVYYCLGAEDNCAQPGTDGVLFGQSYDYQGVTFQCVAGTGLVAPALLANGQPCLHSSDCTSRYCALGPDQYYCLAVSDNCVEPGADGVVYGDSYVYEAATYECVAGGGLQRQ
jgi:hypothetical protein